MQLRKEAGDSFLGELSSACKEAAAVQVGFARTAVHFFDRQSHFMHLKALQKPLLDSQQPYKAMCCLVLTGFVCDSMLA